MNQSTKDFIKSAAAGQARHVLTGAGVWLAGHGVIQSDQQGAFVQIGVGAALYGLGAAWSWWETSGQALVAAQFSRLQGHVAAIPTVPSSLPAAAEVNEAVASAKMTAAVGDAVKN